MSGSDSFPKPAAAVGEVVGEGTVLQKGDEDPLFCLGAIAESYPPQCSGPVLRNWDWASVEQAESASGVTWGSYAVFGTWDGEAFTSTKDPIPLSLYDRMAIRDPRSEQVNAGATSEAELARVHDDLMSSSPRSILGSSIENGYVWVSVIYDDGQVQAYVDGKYGPDVVAVVSALRSVS